MISIDELKKLATLSKLYIDDSELSSYAADLSDIVAFADSISGIETNDITEISGFSLDSLREDIVASSQPSDIIVKNASKSDNGFYVAEVRRHE